VNRGFLRNDMAIKIDLSIEEIKEAIECGRRRQAHDSRHIADQKVCDKSPLDININGAKAEKVVAKLTGYAWNAFSSRFWETPKHDRAADVGPLEVRTNNKLFRVNMLLFQKDGQQMRPHVLVIPISDSVYEIAGWRFGFECMQQSFWQASWKRPCYAAPDVDLYGLRSLENWCISSGHGAWKLTILKAKSR